MWGTQCNSDKDYEMKGCQVISVFAPRWGQKHGKGKDFHFQVLIRKVNHFAWFNENFNGE